MKTALKFILIVAVAAFLVVSMLGIIGEQDKIRCTNLELRVNDSLQTGLISKSEIKSELKAIIKKNKITLKGKETKDINLGKLEGVLSSSPYVDTVHAAFNASGKLTLTAIPRMPILHVMANSGEEYYLDRNGACMPVGNIKGNLPIVTGNISIKFAKDKLAILGRCVQDSFFWRNQVQQIEVLKENDVHLYTRIANHEVILGDLDNIPDKLHRLKVFYQQGLPQTGWNKYKSINVGFQGIVIGTKSNEEGNTEIPL